MIESSQLASAFALGLAGMGHCLGMCGGIAAAMNLGGHRSPVVTVAYHGGRVTSYTLLGAALGLAAGSIEISSWTLALRYLAGLLLIGMGLYIADWWRGMMMLERLGARLWQPVQRLGARWLPIRRWPQAFALGLCWGLMPCGLIYSSLAFAATAQNAVTSAAMMLCFGLGTLPAMLTTSFGADGLQAFLRRRGFKRFIAVALIASGLWTLYFAAAHSGHTGPGQAGDHSHMHHH